MYPIIVAFILLIIICIYGKKKHPFWDKQPVMKQYGKLSKIGSIPTFIINLEKDMYFSENFDTCELEEFLNDEFSEIFNVPKKYLQYIIQTKKSKNICLYNSSKKIIGFIHGREIDLFFEKTYLNMIYVDYLCVHKNYRDKNIAALIISKFLQSYHSKTMFLFKIDKFPLPFKPILKTKYFFKQLNTIKKKINNVYSIDSEKNITELFEYFDILLKRYTVHIHWNLQKFLDVFIHKKILDMIIIQNTYKTLVIGKINTYKFNHQYYKCFEIDFILGDLDNSIQVNHDLSIFLSNYSYKYYTISDIGHHSVFISQNKLQPTYPLYYYTYNLQTPSLHKKHFCININ